MKKMIAFILLAAMVLSIAGCAAQAQANDLLAEVTPQPVSPVADLSGEAAAVTDFGLRLFQSSMESGKNTLISPLSVLYALSMTANGAKNETLSQMETVLGLDVPTLNRWLYSYMKALPDTDSCKLHLANSIWFKDTDTFTVNQDFLQQAANYYDAGIYKAPFDDATRDEINAWVKKHTDGMIPNILDEIPKEAVMYLVNALAFDAKWADPYESYNISDGIFTTESGEKRDVEMMYSGENRYLEDENATGFIKYYKGGDYAFVALLPKDGVTVEEYVQGLNGEHLASLLQNPQAIEVHASMPKFETEYDVEMSEILSAMGMPNAFDGELADLSGLGSSTLGNLRISRVLHKTYICVDEEGTKAGAATVVEILPESAMEPEEYKTVRLDRPFVYMLIDCESNLPFFIGTMMDIEG